MIKILFVCLGNICRSPMAEFIMKDLVEKQGLSDQFQIASAATSSEEHGNPVDRRARQKLSQKGISADGKHAVQMRRQDYAAYDYLIGMEQRNLSAMDRIAGGDPEGKIHRLLDFSSRPRDISDPWYTGDFDTAYEDIYEGCQCLLDDLIRRHISRSTMHNI